MTAARPSRLLLPAIAAILLFGATGCGPSSPEPDFGRSPDGPKIKQLDIDGHSAAFGAGATKFGRHGTGLGSRVAQAIGVTENLLAKSGATLQETGLFTDGWGNVFHNQPRPAKAGRKPVRALPRMALLFYGANDIALQGPDLSVARHAYRAIISRHRAGAVYEAGPTTNASIAPDAAWSPVATKPGEASGDGYLASSGPGTVTIDLKKGPLTRGGTVDLGFVQKLGTSARYKIRVDGKKEGVLRTMSPLTPKSVGYVPEHAAAPFVHRIEGLKPGKHTIEVTADQVIGQAGFDYWQIEPRQAEPVVLVKQYVLPPPPKYPGAPDLANRSEILALNEMTDALAREFGPRVITVDTESVIKQSPSLLSLDLIHPSQAGHDVIAQAILRAIRASSFAGQLPTL